MAKWENYSMGRAIVEEAIAWANEKGYKPFDVAVHVMVKLEEQFTLHRKAKPKRFPGADGHVDLLNDEIVFYK